jgi:hypothetical protein
MRRVLLDDNLDAEFQEEGYVHIPFLSDDEVKYLWDQFSEVLKTSGGHVSPRDAGLDMDYEITYDFTFIDRNPEHKKQVLKVIDAVFRPHYEKILDRYKPIIANYIRKKSETGEVP